MKFGVTGMRKLGPPGELCQSSWLANPLCSPTRLLLQPHWSTHIPYMYRATLIDRTIARAVSRATSRALELPTVSLNCTPNPV